LQYLHVPTIQTCVDYRVIYDTTLQSLYVNKLAVDDDLVDMLYEPSNDLGALEAFVSIITGMSIARCNPACSQAKHRQMQ
jgi:hypothetical protein